MVQVNTLKLSKEEVGPVLPTPVHPHVMHFTPFTLPAVQAADSHSCSALIPPTAAGGGRVPCGGGHQPVGSAALTGEAAAAGEEEPAPTARQAPSRDG